jgi:cyanophycin synthetase
MRITLDNSFLSIRSITLIAVVLFCILIFIYYSNTDTTEIKLNPKYDSDDTNTLRNTYVGTPTCKVYNDPAIASMTMNKSKMNRFLKNRGVPVPKNAFLDLRIMRNHFRDPILLKEYLHSRVEERKLHFPLILKPLKDTSGNGIVSSITDLNRLHLVVSDYLADPNHMSHLLIEEQLKGVVYRLLYVNKKLVAISGRDVPKIVGDGKHTVQELVDAHNDKLLKSKSKNHPMKINDPYISSQGRIRNDVLKKGVSLEVDNVLNYSRGAKTYALPLDSIHPDTREMFDNLFNEEFPANCIGIDFISPDISVSHNENGGSVLEFNSNPARKLHDVMEDGFKERYTKEVNNLKTNN